ncbi:MAG: hypothetical protein PHQ54_01545 [Candidatus Omnitrophica bacterium]|nr:hypothetical protein [Candidatus Omnitrophota bacterium]
MMKITPDYNRFKKIAKKACLIPVYTEVLSDVISPFSLIERFGKDEFCFLLESITGGEHIARYSFVGVSPHKIIRSNSDNIEILSGGTTKSRKINRDILEEIRRELAGYKYVCLDNLPRFSGGFVGYLSYDTVRFFEDINLGNKDDLLLYDAFLMEARDLYIFDHIRQRLIILTHVFIDSDNINLAYQKAVLKLKKMCQRLVKNTGISEPQLLK